MPHVYGLDAKATKIVADAALIATEVAAKHASDVDQNARFPAEAIDALAAKGFLGLCVPTALGGMGQGARTFVAVVEELAQACSSTALIFVMHVTGLQAIAASKTLAAREEILRPAAAGKHLTTLAFADEGSLPEIWAPVSKLEPKGDGFVTSADKAWVTAAGRADSYVASGQKPGATSPTESTIYLARKGGKGLRIAGGSEGLGLRGNDSAPLALEGYTIPKTDLISEPGAGAPVLMEVVLPWFSMGTSALANGIARAAVTVSAKHLAATSIEHGGSLLRDLPQLRARLAEMSVRTAQSRALLGQLLGEMEAPIASTPISILQSRLAALQCAVDVTDLGMKACGAAAFSKHMPLERMFRDARAGWVMAPTVDQLLDFVGRSLTGLPLF